MSKLKLALLGSPHISIAEKSVVIESRKALALLCYLAVTRQRQSRDLLATLLWPEQDQSRARASLRQALWLLRNADLEPWLVVEQDALALQGEYWCDIHAFQQALDAGTLDDALALYRGDFLSGFTLRDCPEFDQWQFLQADMLRRHLSGALELAVLRCTDSAEYGRGLDFARRWLALDPLHEPVHRHLMQLYAYAGQHAAALRQYEECARLLRDELGVEPDEETHALFQAIRSRQLTPPAKAQPETPSAMPSAGYVPRTGELAPTPAAAPATTSTMALAAAAVAEVAEGGHSPSVLRPSAPPPPLHNLPVQLTPFVGRETEIEELAKVIAAPECRLVTIVGPGGIGKTRLALEVARLFVTQSAQGVAEAKEGPEPIAGNKIGHDAGAEPKNGLEPRPVNGARHDGSQTAMPQSSADLFPHGVLFVALNAVESANSMVAAIAEAGGFVFYSNEATRQQLLEYLRERKMLLVLDNFEHLLAHASLVVDILTHAPNMTVLVTSREALNLQGEWLWSVQGLRFPESELAPEWPAEDAEALWTAYSAVRMFVQSARRIQPDFALAAELPHVVRICRLVGGMPLAIELAVTWLRVIPCAQIAREIERDLDFLTTRLRDVPDRHRSIHAVFEHSWRLLSASEQATFQQLSIFRGGFTRYAAEQVAGASWRDLAALVEKSLLNINSQGRYAVHELLRQYGASKLESNLEEKLATHARFCSYFAGFLAAREQMLNGPSQLQAAADIAAELDNIRAACQWALQERRLDDISRSATAFYFFCQLQSRFLEGAHTLEEFQACVEAMEPSPKRDLSLAHIYCHLGWLYIRLGELERAETVLQRARVLYAEVGSAPQRFMGGDPLIPLALVRNIQGNFYGALALATEALQWAEAKGDLHNLAFTHYALTTTNLALGDYATAQAHVKAARAAARAIGTRWFLPYILNESGKVARAMNNFAEAEQLFHESYAIKQEFNDPEGMAVALNHLGELAYLSGDLVTAHQRYVDAMGIYGEINDRGGLAISLRGLGQIACANGDYRAARMWFEQSFQIAMAIHFWPLIYTLLLNVSHLLMQTGAAALAIEALVLALNQAGSDHETKERATQLLVQWQNVPDTEQFLTAVQQGTDGEVEPLLRRILSELAAA